MNMIIIEDHSGFQAFHIAWSFLWEARNHWAPYLNANEMREEQDRRIRREVPIGLEIKNRKEENKKDQEGENLEIG